MKKPKYDIEKIAKRVAYMDWFMQEEYGYRNATVLKKLESYEECLEKLKKLEN